MARSSESYEDWAWKRRWSIVGYASGATLAVTSGILFWISRPRDSTKDKHAGLTCAPTLNGLLCEHLW
jgi:hypothetical protein